MSKIKMKKIHTVVFLALLAVIVGLLFVIKTMPKDQEYVEGYTEEQVGLEEIKAELSTEAFPAIDWTEIFSGSKKGYLTIGTLRQIVQEIGVADYIEIPGRGKRRAVTREEWNTVFSQMLDYLDMSDVITEDTFLVLGWMEAPEQNVLITNKGDYYTNLPVAFFDQWQAYRIYQSEDVCLGVAGFSEEEEEVLDAYLKQMTEENVTFLYQGGEYEKELNLQSNIEPGVCDFVFQGTEITKIREKRDTIAGDLLSYDADFIEIEGYGKVVHEGKLPVYKTYGEVAETSISEVVLGNMELTYITGGDQVHAILLEKPANIADIRVLLLADGGGKFRDHVYLKCTADAAVGFGETTADLAAQALLSADEYFDGGNDHTLIVQSKDENGEIYICDETGNAVSNGYAGTVEVRRYDEGFTIVNELPFEEYLYAVVPSEMPSSFSAEALKAQAVCARSYAYGQLLSADLAAYGAHIDDSTSYQVYNKVARTQPTTDAVDATYGQVLMYGGNVIQAYYFSTSMGYTGTAEVWNVENIENLGYLKQACLNEQEFDGDLSTEEGFAAYIGTTTNGYDSDIKFYRWTGMAVGPEHADALDMERRTEEINEIVRSRHQASARNVVIYREKEEEALDDIDGFGALTDITVQERNLSGAIITLHLEYENGHVLVKTEYNVRKVLGALVEKLTYADGSETDSVTLLPSAYCTVEPQEDGTLLLRGGGYGHGLGMSQNGANGMAKAGKNYLDILNFFYQNIEIEEMGKVSL